MFDLLLEKAVDNFFKGNIEESKRLLASCLMLEPSNKLAMLCYAIIDLMPENPESSKQLMRYAVAADEDEIDELLSHIFNDQEDRSDDSGFSVSWMPNGSSKITKRVKDDLETAVKIDPKFSEAELFLGKIYRKMGDYGTAAEHLQKSLLINPFELEAIDEIKNLISEYNKKPVRKEKS